jgi:hypothetical protein
MRVEVIINGRLTATKEVQEMELRGNPYDSFEKNCERRERIIKSYLKEITRELRPVLKGYSAYQVEYRLIFPSKMNRPGFKVKDYQLKTA